MKDFLKETFRPNTEAERQAISRHHQQRAIVGAITMLVMLVVIGITLLSKTLSSLQFQGTWIATDDYADGFHPEDVYLEFKDGVFYRSGSKYGRLQSRNGQNVIPVNAPLGRYDRTLSVNGDRLTIAYEPPQTPVIYSGSQSGSPYASIAQIVQAQPQQKRIVDTYVRISTDCDLTEEERDALY